MKFNTKQLAHGLELADLAMYQRNTIPILGCALITAEHDTSGSVARIRGTDLDVEIDAFVPILPDDDAAIDKPRPMDIAAAINSPAAIARLIRAGADVVSLERAEGADPRVNIESGPLAGSISTLPAEDFPNLSFAPTGRASATLGENAIDMILRVSKAMSTEETRYYLNGVFIHHLEDWTFRVVSTDGHRLHIGTIALPDFSPGVFDMEQLKAGMIIPRRVINILRRLRSRMAPEKPIVLSFSSGQAVNRENTLAPEARGEISRVALSFQAASLPVVLRSKLIDGKFPDYSRVIPKVDPDYPSISFKRKDLAAAIDAITAGAREKTKAIKLTFDPSGKLTVSMKWIDAGFDGKIEIPATMPSGSKHFEIGYNGIYLRQIIDASLGDELSINVSDPGAPGVLVDPDATDFKTVLMPMRI